MSHHRPPLLLPHVPVSRRRLLAGGLAAAGGVALAGVIGCSGDGDGASGIDGSDVRTGGILRTGTTLGLSYGLDPHLETAGGLAIFPKVYGYMLHVDPDDERLILDHASNVEQPDEKTFIVRLRDGIAFQDIAPVNGRNVAGDDVVQSIRRYREHQLVADKTWFTTVLDQIAANELSVLITTSRPNVYSLYQLGSINGGAIIPAEIIGDEDRLKTAGVGSGPFMILGTGDGALIRLGRHDGYFRTPLPYLDGMDWQIFDANDAKVDAFRERKLDVSPLRNREEAEQMALASKKIAITSEPSLAYLSIGLKVDRPPFQDPRVREAIDIALDRQAMIRDITLQDGEIVGPVNQHMAQGFWSLPASEISAASWGGVPLEDRLRAARMLLAAGGADGATIRLQVAKVPELLDVASVVKEQLQRVGLTVLLETTDLLRWFLQFRTGEFEATLISHIPYETPDGPTRLYHSKGADGNGNSFGFSDPWIDALIERSWEQTDREERRGTLLQAQQMMLEARPMVHLFTSRSYSAAWSYVQNRKPELRGSLARYNYEQWLDRG